MADFMLCDIHSHILPGVDDGCKNTAEAIALLNACTTQGIGRVFLTPHYYHTETVSEFLEKREHAWSVLRNAMDEENASFPELHLGAEVAFFRGISYEDNINRLCLGNSDYLLLEMPFRYWSASILTELNSLIAASGLNIVIAHLERYLKLQDKESLQSLFDTGALIQMNAEFILSNRHKAKKLIHNGMVDVLGSDCHNLVSRVQNLGTACHWLLKAGMREELFSMMDTAHTIFERIDEKI